MRASEIHSPHLNTNLGMHVAMLRLAKRLMADDGYKPEAVEAFFGRRLNKEHGGLLRAVIRKATGVSINSLEDATSDQMQAACMEQLRQIFETENKAYAYYPPGWEQTAEMVMARSKREPTRVNEIVSAAKAVERAANDDEPEGEVCELCQGGGILFNRDNSSYECKPCEGSGRVKVKTL